jgi:hypothetical protein
MENRISIDCEHVWEHKIDSMGDNEYFSDVICIICNVSGQLNHKTQEVFYPAT